MVVSQMAQNRKLEGRRERKWRDRDKLPIVQENTSFCSCVCLWEYKDSDFYWFFVGKGERWAQKMVLKHLNERYLQMMVIFEGVHPSSLTKGKSWSTNLEYTCNLQSSEVGEINLPTGL